MVWFIWLVRCVNWAILGMENARAETERLKAIVEQKKATASELRTKLDAIDAEVETITVRLAKYAAFRNKLEKRDAKMSSLKGQLELAATRVEERANTTNYKKSSNDSAVGALRSEIASAKGRIAELEKSLESDRKKLQDSARLVAELAAAAVQASFADDAVKRDLLAEIDAYVTQGPAREHART